ncbi:MAG: DEAD/DEAH box helicase [Parvularculaceae bacterium]
MPDGALSTSDLPPVFAGWFAARGWRPRAHQLACLEAARAGRSHLLIAPTGGGKTLAGFLPSLIEIAEAGARRSSYERRVHTLYISPLKALAVDIARNVEAPCARWICRSALKRARATLPHRAGSGRNIIRRMFC